VTAVRKNVFYEGTPHGKVKLACPNFCWLATLALPYCVGLLRSLCPLAALALPLCVGLLCPIVLAHYIIGVHHVPDLYV